MAIEWIIALSNRVLAVVGPPAPYENGNHIRTPTLGDALENLQRLVGYAEHKFVRNGGVRAPDPAFHFTNEGNGNVNERMGEGAVRNHRSVGSRCF
jgi:hypothetical protein